MQAIFIFTSEHRKQLKLKIGNYHHFVQNNSEIIDEF